MFNKIIIALLLTLSTLYSANHINSYALIIGVDEGNLIGAKNDANEMERLLHQKGIKFITTLHDKRATKRNIINAFNHIVTNANTGDWVYLFFSGHGTSFFDPAVKDKQLKESLRGTGGLIPWGVTPNQYRKKIILSKRDLVPLFIKLEKKTVHTVVIFDACFSGMAYKDLYNSVAKGTIPIYIKASRTAKYPYKNIIYLSATTQSDYAVESREKKRGYFSMAITNCLKRNNSLNNLRRCVSKYNLPQTPIILPNYNKPLFPQSTKKELIYQSPRPIRLKEKLLNLAQSSESFELYTQKNKSDITSRNYNSTQPLILHLRSEKLGYFVLFMLSAKDKNGYRKLTLAYPNNQSMPKIRAKTNKKILKLEATPPFGEEDMSAFLVDEKSAKALQKIYNRTGGGIILKESEIRELIYIIERGQKCGSRFSILSCE
ncbi:MAG TPA: caspase family protein [Campylobacterales bacterium]|nr:caspase family protein [Campylobacterales bacterium]